MFGLSWAEILLIAIVIIICVDPKDIPGVMRKLAEFTRKFKSFSREFTDVFTGEIDDSKGFIKDLKGQMQKTYDISDLKTIHADRKVEEPHAVPETEITEKAKNDE